MARIMDDEGSVVNEFPLRTRSREYGASSRGLLYRCGVLDPPHDVPTDASRPPLQSSISDGGHDLTDGPASEACLLPLSPHNTLSLTIWMPDLKCWWQNGAPTGI